MPFFLKGKYTEIVTGEAVKLGKVIDFPWKGDRCQTKGIVIAKANGEDTLDIKKLGQLFQKILLEDVTEKAKRVAVHTSLIYDKFLSLKDLIEVYLANILAVWVKHDVYLVCHPSGDVNKTAQIIDNHYQAKGPGFYRQSQVPSIYFQKSKSNPL